MFLLVLVCYHLSQAFSAKSCFVSTKSQLNAWGNALAASASPPLFFAGYQLAIMAWRIVIVTWIRLNNDALKRIPKTRPHAELPIYGAPPLTPPHPPEGKGEGPFRGGEGSSPSLPTFHSLHVRSDLYAIHILAIPALTLYHSRPFLTEYLHWLNSHVGRSPDFRGFFGNCWYASQINFNKWVIVVSGNFLPFCFIPFCCLPLAIRPDCHLT